MYKTYDELLASEMSNNRDPRENLESINLSPEEMSSTFRQDYGCADDIKPLRAWTKNFVYFSAEVEGAVYVASVPRSPCYKTTTHI